MEGSCEGETEGARAVLPVGKVAVDGVEVDPGPSWCGAVWQAASTARRSPAHPQRTNEDRRAAIYPPKITRGIGMNTRIKMTNAKTASRRRGRSREVIWSSGSA